MLSFPQLMVMIGFVLLVHVFFLFAVFNYSDHVASETVRRELQTVGGEHQMVRSELQAVGSELQTVGEEHQMARSELQTEESQISPSPEVHCKDSLCSNYLTKLEEETFCGLNRKYLQMKEPPCKFVNGTRRRVVGLASFPGSGNTWVRGMLQKATGICTGSVYCDGYLKMNEFPGESVVSPSVLVVKTHESPPSDVFDTAIVIMRNPFHALIAERARRVKGHVNEAGQKYYGIHDIHNTYCMA